MTAPLLLHCRLQECDHGRPLLDLLCRRFPYHDGARWQQLLARGMVQLDGLPASPDQPAAAGDDLSYLLEDHTEPEVPTDFEILLETPELILAGKAAGTPVTRAGLIVRRTLVNILRDHYRQEIHPLHRLDRETSGLILCARSPEACRRFQRHGEQPMLDKFYLALVQGHLAAQGLEVTQPLAPRPESAIRCRMWPEADGKPCRTVFHTIASADTFSLLLARLHSGRRHQIRAHLAHLGHPLVGDKIYGHGGFYYLERFTRELTPADYLELGARNHTLHAWSLRLRLPGAAPQRYFSDFFSADFSAYLQRLPGWREKALRLLAAATGETIPLQP